MIRYDQKLTALMDEREYYINENGLDICVKPVPDGEPDMLDPREERMLRKSGGFPTSDGGGVEVMRNNMGFPNLNLNTKEIITKYKEIPVPSENRSVPVWIYYPRRPIGKTGRAAMIYLHGGGWVGGSAPAVENPCRLIAEKADCVVFNVEYSLAPENKYPAAVVDCRNVLLYVREHADEYGVDAGKICMGGDSAGANITASVAMWDRDCASGLLRCQVLIYPAVTFAERTPGYEEKPVFNLPNGQRALAEPMLHIGEGNLDILYLSPEQSREDPYVSPAFGSKSGLCPALISTAEYDGLRAQGEIFARQMKKSGCDVRFIRYRGVGHAFIDKLGYLPQAENMVLEIAKYIKAL